MKARPILFSGAMVRALLAGTKTQTRRIVKPQPYIDPNGNVAVEDNGGRVRLYGQHPGGAPNWDSFKRWRCPYGVPGDLLIVRESFTTCNEGSRAAPRLVPMYAADWEGFDKPYRDWDWSPSIHMPRWASRLTLEITEVRVERLQDISSEDALAEGIKRHLMHDQVWMGPATPQLLPYYVAAYRDLWNEINGPDGWAANPWVWAISFTVHQRNVDALLSDRSAA